MVYNLDLNHGLTYMNWVSFKLNWCKVDLFSYFCADLPQSKSECQNKTKHPIINQTNAHTNDLCGSWFGNSRMTFWLLINQNKRTHLPESYIPSRLSQTPTARCGDDVSKWLQMNMTAESWGGCLGRTSYPPRGHGKWQGDKLKRPPHWQTSFKSKQFNRSFKYKTERWQFSPLLFVQNWPGQNRIPFYQWIITDLH